jgi:hypothetical protein
VISLMAVSRCFAIGEANGHCACTIFLGTRLHLIHLLPQDALVKSSRLTFLTWMTVELSAPWYSTRSWNVADAEATWPDVANRAGINEATIEKIASDIATFLSY